MYNIAACKDPEADNYYARADIHDKSKCSYGGCTNPDAANYNPSVRFAFSPPALQRVVPTIVPCVQQATYHDGTCTYEAQDS